MTPSSRDLFRSRRIAQFFPIGVAVAFIFGIVAAPTLLGSTSVVGCLLAGAVIGLAGSAALFRLLKLLDRR